MVERYFLAPPRFSVARLTTGTELTLMGIHLLVTGDTRNGQFLFVEITLVTGVTLHLLMLTFERKLGRFGMIEAHVFPFFGNVTCLALHPIAAAMRVLRLVAINARTRQVFVALTNMASGTQNIFMGAFERKFRLAMIISFLLAPRILAVAPRAIFAKFAFVGIVFLMAAKTRQRG